MSKAEENDFAVDVAPADSARAAGSTVRISIWVVRVREFVGRWTWAVWIVGLLVLSLLWWCGKYYFEVAYFRYWLNAGLQMVADPSHLAEVLLGIGITVVLALWGLPKWQAAGSQGISAENRFDRENEARKTLAQIIAGIFVLAGLYSSVNTFNIQRDTENLQREGQITDRYTKAIDQLGALAPGGGVDGEGRPKINLEVRLGGIYALERIAKDSPKDHWTIMEVLTAYVRQNGPVKDRTKPTERCSPQIATKQPLVEPEKMSAMRADVQAILNVIGRRDTGHDPPLSHLDLAGANLSGANLSRAHLSGADLSGADLSGAELTWASLDRADLSESNLNGAELVGADLNRASLYGAHLHCAHISEANFTEADLRGADLTWADHFTQRQLIGTSGNKETKLPTELERFRPYSWSK